jgi:hypothetical protein
MRHLRAELARFGIEPGAWDIGRTLLIAMLVLGGCAKQSATPVSSEVEMAASQNPWYFESYSVGPWTPPDAPYGVSVNSALIGVRHDGFEYQAHSMGTESWGDGDKKKKRSLDACPLALNLIGTSVQDAALLPGKHLRRDANGYTTSVLFPGEGDLFDLQQWGLDKTGRTHYVVCLFQITSKTNIGGTEHRR